MRRPPGCRQHEGNGQLVWQNPHAQPSPISPERFAMAEPPSAQAVDSRVPGCLDVVSRDFTLAIRLRVSYQWAGPRSSPVPPQPSQRSAPSCSPPLQITRVPTQEVADTHDRHDAASATLDVRLRASGLGLEPYLEQRTHEASVQTSSLSPKADSGTNYFDWEVRGPFLLAIGVAGCVMITATLLAVAYHSRAPGE